MKKQFTNPYWAVLLVPLVAFLTMIGFQVSPDDIGLVGRILVFGLLGYVGARYVGRAPMLMWEKDTTAPARNVVGWAICLVGFMLQIAYGWVYIAYDRPAWLSSQYYGSGIIVLVGVGLAVVATSVPRFPPFGDGRNGLSEAASALVVIISAIAVFVVSHIPNIANAFKSIFGGLSRAL